jgi:hypothetical protein
MIKNREKNINPDLQQRAEDGDSDLRSLKEL